MHLSDAWRRRINGADVVTCALVCLLKCCPELLQMLFRWLAHSLIRQWIGLCVYQYRKQTLTNQTDNDAIASVATGRPVSSWSMLVDRCWQLAPMRTPTANATLIWSFKLRIIIIGSKLTRLCGTITLHSTRCPLPIVLWSIAACRIFHGPDARHRPLCRALPTTNLHRGSFVNDSP